MSEHKYATTFADGVQSEDARNLPWVSLGIKWAAASECAGGGSVCRNKCSTPLAMCLTGTERRIHFSSALECAQNAGGTPSNPTPGCFSLSSIFCAEGHVTDTCGGDPRETLTGGQQLGGDSRVIGVLV